MPVAAGVITNAFLVTLIALFDMPAQRGRPAGFNRAQHPPLRMRQRKLLLVSRAVLSNNIGQFQRWPRHLLLLLRPASFPLSRRQQPVERTDDFGQAGRRDRGITRRGIDALVAQQRLDHPDVFTAFQ